MKIGVAQKLFLAILTTAGLAVVSSAMIMQRSLYRGFLKLFEHPQEKGVCRGELT